MIEFFTITLYEPLLNILLWIYTVLPFQDLGVSIIILTLLIRLLLFYPSLKALRSQKSLQDLQPKMDALKKKHADDKEKLGKEMMELYKNNKVNPFSSCIPMLIQLPVLYALFRVFFGGLEVQENGFLAVEQLHHLYAPLQPFFETQPINKIFLGIVDLGATHNIFLAVIAGGLQFLQTRMLQSKKPKIKSEGAKDENMAANISKQMMYFFPIITIVFGYQFPAGVTLYWLSSTGFTWVQQLIFMKEKDKMKEEDEKGETKNIVDTTATEKKIGKKSEKKKELE